MKAERLAELRRLDDDDIAVVLECCEEIERLRRLLGRVTVATLQGQTEWATALGVEYINGEPSTLA